MCLSTSLQRAGSQPSLAYASRLLLSYTQERREIAEATGKLSVVNHARGLEVPAAIGFHREALSSLLSLVPSVLPSLPNLPVASLPLSPSPPSAAPRDLLSSLLRMAQAPLSFLHHHHHHHHYSPPPSSSSSSSSPSWRADRAGATSSMQGSALRPDPTAAAGGAGGTWGGSVSILAREVLGTAMARAMAAQGIRY